MTKENFLRRVLRTGKCWVWGGGRDRDGYGRVHSRYPPRGQRAHRIAYELFVGPIPAGMCVCHRCDYRLCVRPDHLFLGTHAENTADRDIKGRTSRGEKHPFAVLRDDDVRTIRKRYAAGGISQTELGKVYGVRQTMISMIVLRQKWKHV